ncbi:SRPBCC domain-containing protein [Virgisporangium aliadipatigenens]|nr:SRPBCC domain-containing protein [Virgisporangium aliadipatigenens]
MAVGQTKDVGWNIGVSKTLDHPLDRVWEFVVGPGLPLWLGEGVAFGPDAAPGDPYETADGTVGELRGFRPADRIRLTHLVRGADHETTVQVAMRAPAPGRTMLRFHEERMLDAAEREAQRVHWQAAMERVAAALDGHPS